MLEEASGLAATFSLDGDKDIPSDGEPHRFRVLGKEVLPDLALVAAPLLEPTVYQVARFTAPSAFPLFPGSPVVHFVGGQRLGQAPLSPPSAGRPFELGFGPHKAMRVTFERVERKQAEVGAFTKERQWTLRERFVVSSGDGEARDVEVQDRMLKPTSDKVKVELLPTTTAGWREATPGVRTWTVKLAPQASTTLTLDHQIRAPKDGELEGLPELDQ